MFGTRLSNSGSFGEIRQSCGDLKMAQLQKAPVRNSCSLAIAPSFCSLLLL